LLPWAAGNLGIVASWLQTLSIVSLAVAAACAAWLALDVARRPQTMWIMNVVWPVTALYFGPLAVWFYYRAGRRSAEGTERSTHGPFWVAAAVDTTHCGAGCTIGDVVAECGLFFSGTTIAGSRLVTSLIGDFTGAYLFGIAFQYFTIAPMRGISGWPGIRAAIKADTLAVTAFEVGLFLWMWAVSVVEPVLKPDEPAYWFSMQIGMIVGYCTSLPMNWWLIKVGIKEPM
jgi:Domain of unknown function (DUF4396)